MKRIIALLLILICVLGLVGCGGIMLFISIMAGIKVVTA